MVFLRRHVIFSCATFYFVSIKKLRLGNLFGMMNENQYSKEVSIWNLHGVQMCCLHLR